MLKLRKALNGLRRASLVFQNVLFRILTEIFGFKKVVTTPRVVYHTETNVKLLVHVDDPLLHRRSNFGGQLLRGTGRLAHDEDHRGDRPEASRVPRHTRDEDAHGIPRAAEKHIEEEASCDQE